MKTDKELAMQLVDSLEENYLRYTLLETILDVAKVPGWRQIFEEVFPLPEAWASVRRRYQPVRDRILDAPDLTTAMREMLKDTPGNDPKGSA
jgi:hypothetical protein